jgi:hypothetical protein
MRYRVIADLAICKVDGERMPLWALAVIADPFTRFVQLLRSPGEITVVCPTESIPTTESGVEAHAGYIALQLEGPFPLDAVGILKAFIAPLAEAKVPIFAISSFETDFVLIQAARSQEAMERLNAAGHERVEG